jgi:hypothetical protein
MKSYFSRVGQSTRLFGFGALWGMSSDVGCATPTLVTFAARLAPPAELFCFRQIFWAPVERDGSGLAIRGNKRLQPSAR